MSKERCPYCNYEWESKKRSPQANKYAHLIIGRIAEYTGDSFIATKNMLKYEGGFFTEVPKHSSSEQLVVALEETHLMSSRRMGEFVDFAFMYANSIGVNILTPEEYYEQQTKEESNAQDKS